ncbi:hypothetical protein PQR02_02285 [Paraburkholderia sediminicola]|uniref:Uncharacterized protein n=1 Tax=Paraburkholderia rhynchosiae TaxID=487049 RepID=A0ACC7N7Q6_9BURK
MEIHDVVAAVRMSLPEVVMQDRTALCLAQPKTRLDNDFLHQKSISHALCIPD